MSNCRMCGKTVQGERAEHPHKSKWCSTECQRWAHSEP